MGSVYAVRCRLVRFTLAAAAATAALLGAAAPAGAQTQYYDFSGNVNTNPFNFFPIDRSLSFYDMRGNTMGVGSGTSLVGSFSAFGGAHLKIDSFYVGGGGTGRGELRFSGTGTLVEIGGANHRMDIGGWGTGSMTVESGALVDATVNAAACSSGNCYNFIGNLAGSTATLNVTGAGSELRTLRNFFVGAAGVVPGFGTPGGRTEAFVNVLDGGTLRTETATVSFGPIGGTGAESSGAIVSIDGPGSQWIVTRNSVDNTNAYFNAATHANAQATINITNGGKLVIDGTGVANAGTYQGIGLGSNGGRADLFVSGAGSAVEVNGPNPYIDVGYTGARGSFNVLQGATASAMFLNVGRYAGSQGLLQIDGAGSQLKLSDVGTPGFEGTAFATIGRDGGHGAGFVTNGGSLLITNAGGDTRPSARNPGMIIGNGTGSFGSLTIDGAGSKVEIIATSLGLGGGVPDNYNPWMTVGYLAGSSGTLRVENGGKLLLTGNAVSTVADSRGTRLYIGGHSDTVAGGSGSAFVSGLGSEIRLSGVDTYMLVGRGAGSIGLLDISNQGLVASTGLGVGRVGTGYLNMNQGTLDLRGQWTGDNQSGAFLTIGNRGGTGQATIDNGSRVTLTNMGTSGASLNLGGTGPNPLGNGTLALLGGSQIKITAASGLASMTVGRDGTGLLVTDGGSSIDVGDGKVYIARLAGSTGHVLLSGASTLTAGYVGVGRDAGVDGGTGTLIISGSTVNAPIVEIGANGYLGGRNGVINGDVYNSGEVGPGESRGRLIINGAFYGSARSPVSTSGLVPMEAGAPGRLILEIESDGHGGFLTDELVLTKGSDFDFAGMRIVFSFLGDANPNLFDKAHGFEMDTFLRSLDGTAEGGLSQVFAPGTDWGDVLVNSQFRARAQQFTDIDLAYNPVDGSFEATAIPGVPEPATWLLMLGGVLLLAGVRGRERVASPPLPMTGRRSRAVAHRAAFRQGDAS